MHIQKQSLGSRSSLSVTLHSKKKKKKKILDTHQLTVFENINLDWINFNIFGKSFIRVVWDRLA